MSPLLNAAVFLINIAFSFYIYILIFRVLMQKYNVSWHNPLAQIVIRCTKYVVNITRRIAPGFKGIDLSIVLLIIILEGVRFWLIQALSGVVIKSILGVLVISIAAFIDDLLGVYFFMIIVVAIFSWFASARPNPLASICVTIVQPVMAMCRRVIPSISGIDLSPLICLVVIQLVKILFLMPLSNFGVSLL